VLPPVEQMTLTVRSESAGRVSRRAEQGDRDRRISGIYRPGVRSSCCRPHSSAIASRRRVPQQGFARAWSRSTKPPTGLGRSHVRSGPGSSRSPLNRLAIHGPRPTSGVGVVPDLGADLVHLACQLAGDLLGVGGRGRQAS